MQLNENKNADLQYSNNYQLNNQDLNKHKTQNSNSGGLQIYGSQGQSGSHDTARQEEKENVEKTQSEQAALEGKQLNTTNIDQKVERNINHFYNCKFVIKSREGSKTTLKDVGGTLNSNSQSRSKEGKNEDVQIDIKDLSETPRSPGAIDDQRVQKIIEKIGSYASFKLTNQKPQEAQIAVDQSNKIEIQQRSNENTNGLTKLNLAMTTSQQIKLQNQARNGFLANPSLTPQSGRGAGQLQHIVNMLSNNRRKEDQTPKGQGQVTPSNNNSALNVPHSGLLRVPSNLESKKPNQWANRENIFDSFQNPDIFMMNQAPSLSSQCQNTGNAEKRAIQNQGLNQQQQKSSMLLRLLGAQNQQQANMNLAYSSALKQANGSQALKLIAQPRSNNGRGASRNISPIKPTEKKTGEFFTKLQKIALSARISKEQELTEFDKSPQNIKEPATPNKDQQQQQKQFFSLRQASFKEQRHINIDNAKSPQASISKMSNKEALQAILPLIAQRQMSSKSRSQSKREDANQALECQNAIPSFERQNVGIVSNLALANLNQDIEDIVPHQVQKDNQNKPLKSIDQIQQIQDALENKNLAKVLMNQLGRANSMVNSPAASNRTDKDNWQNQMSYQAMRMKAVNKQSQFSTNLQQQISACNDLSDKKDKK